MYIKTVKYVFEASQIRKDITALIEELYQKKIYIFFIMLKISFSY